MDYRFEISEEEDIVSEQVHDLDSEYKRKESISSLYTLHLQHKNGEILHFNLRTKYEKEDLDLLIEQWLRRLGVGPEDVLDEAFLENEGEMSLCLRYYCAIWYEKRK